MNHPWPPNDAERADWDRRAEAYQARIDTLTNELAAAKAEVLSTQQALLAKGDEVTAAQAERDAEKAVAASYRTVIEFYAGEVTDHGERAREAL